MRDVYRPTNGHGISHASVDVPFASRGSWRNPYTSPHGDGVHWATGAVRWSEQRGVQTRNSSHETERAYFKVEEGVMRRESRESSYMKRDRRERIIGMNELVRSVPKTQGIHQFLIVHDRGSIAQSIIRKTKTPNSIKSYGGDETCEMRLKEETLAP